MLIFLSWLSDDAEARLHVLHPPGLWRGDEDASCLSQEDFGKLQ